MAITDKMVGLGRGKSYGGSSASLTAKGRVAGKRRWRLLRFICYRHGRTVAGIGSSVSSAELLIVLASEQSTPLRWTMALNGWRLGGSRVWSATLPQWFR